MTAQTPIRSKKPQQHNIIAVVGPTASGKSEYAVQLAKKVNGEIISADSRQVYKGLDIGTGKVAGAWVASKKDGRTVNMYMYKRIPHHCIDFVHPKKQYSVAEFKKDAEHAIEQIIRRGKLPILCGGTGQFIDAVLFNQSIPEVPPNILLRKKLEKKTTDVLFAELQTKDPVRAKTIDAKNKRRLIRALEIIYATGKPVPLAVSKSAFDAKIIYLNPPLTELYKKIERRLRQRLRQGMLKEARTLHAKGLSWKRMEQLGLEYRYMSRFLQRKISKEQLFSQLFSEIKKYAKRQQTWFKKYPALTSQSKKLDKNPQNTYS